MLACRPKGSAWWRLREAWFGASELMMAWGWCWMFMVMNESNNPALPRSRLARWAKEVAKRFISVLRGDVKVPGNPQCFHKSDEGATTWLSVLCFRGWSDPSSATEVCLGVEA